MSHMVCAELDLVAITCCSCWKRHHTSIQKQNVQSVLLACKFPDRGLYIGQVCEIAFYEFDGRRWDCCFDLFYGGEGFVIASGCKIDTLWVVLGELKDRLFSKTDIAFAEDLLDTKSRLEG
jgi:hypothetical protein